jgi:GR25 family glycosyltransferase involved in LPS biosynthesis
MILPTYVIHLGESFSNRQSLIDIGLEPVGFKGINAKKNEHLRYADRITPMCQYFCPKSPIGCGLSHILLADTLFQKQVPMALILEDDAYPLVQSIDFEQIIQSVPPDWELIKLHCDPNCKDGEYRVIKEDEAMSTAAYIINTKGIQKLKDMKLSYHIDHQLFWSNIKQYKSRRNLFWTDESSSNIRVSQNTHWFIHLMKLISKPLTSGEKSIEQIHSYPVLRIPFIDVELAIGNVIDLCIFLIVVYLLI